MNGIIASNMGPGAAPAAPPEQAAGGNTPEYDQAMELAMAGLYDQGIAKDIAKQVASTDDIPQALADATYQVLQIVDEQVGGVADEELVPLAAEVLNEVAEIAEAAGAQIVGRDIAAAMRLMAVRVAKELGGDASQIEQALAGISDDDVASQADGQQDPAAA